MSITFEQPIWLLTLLLIAPIALSAWRWFQAMSRARLVVSVALRSVVIALFACMLAGAASVRTSDRLAVIAVIDISESVTQFADFGADPQRGQRTAGEAIEEWIRAAAGERTVDDLLGVIVFDGDSIALSLPSTRDETSVRTDFSLAPGTDIEHALRFAAALFPPDASRRMLLVSDGAETQGAAVEAAREIASGAAGRETATAIDVLPIAYRVRDEVMIASIDAPPTAASDSSVTVRVVLQATDAARGTLELLYDDEVVDINGGAPGTGRPVTLEAGRQVVVIPNVQLAPDPVHRFEAVFVPDDQAADRLTTNNRAGTFTITPGRGAVLIVDGVGDGTIEGAGGAVARVLDDADLQIEVITPQQLPENLLDYQAYDLVIFQNVAADEISRPVQEHIADYVTDLGGGFLMTGGYESFGAGGWKGSPIAEVLPVDLEMPEQLITPPAAIAIVLDNSGSMSERVMGGARSQQEIANDGAAIAIEMLDGNDLVSVITFNSTYNVVVPMQRNATPRETAQRVRGISPGGGTNMYPAMERAFRELSTVEANVKHVLVLSDGQSEGSTAEGVNLAKRMKDEGISVSTIAVGDAPDEFTLSEIADAGGGRFYRVYNPNVLPRIFVKDIRVVRRPLVRLGRFTPVVNDPSSPILRGINGPFPPLGGVDLTQPRAEPRITYAMKTPEGEPLLAHWFVGRGQVGAFTSDAHDWAQPWLGWPGFGQFWTQAARQLSRPSGARGYELVSEIVDDELRIRLDARNDDGQPLDLLTVEGVVYGPDGREYDVDLAQTGPGAYRAAVPATARGNYIVALSPRRGNEALAPVIGGATRVLGPEFRRLRSNTGLLREIADTTGGRVFDWERPDLATLFDRRDIEPARAEMPIWPVLMAWAIFAFILDVGCRRVAWDRFFTREFAEAVREQATDQVRQRSEKAAATLSALRDRPERRETIESDAAPATTPHASAPPRSPKKKPARPAESPDSDEERRRREREEEMERRRERLRKEMLESLRTGRAPSAKPARPKDDGPSEPPKSDSDTTSGLLAAKRRARERYSGRDEGEGGD